MSLSRTQCHISLLESMTISINNTSREEVLKACRNIEHSLMHNGNKGIDAEDLCDKRIAITLSLVLCSFHLTPLLFFLILSGYIIKIYIDTLIVSTIAKRELQTFVHNQKQIQHAHSYCYIFMRYRAV